MKNPADLLEVCLELIKYIDNGDPAKDVIEQTPYSETELIYELALDYVQSRETVTSVLSRDQWRQHGKRLDTGLFWRRSVDLGRER